MQLPSVLWCYMPRLSQHGWFYDPNNIRRVMRFFTFKCPSAQNIYLKKFEVLTAVNTKTTTFLDVTRCNWVAFHRRYWITYCFCLQDCEVRQESSVLKMEAVRSYETSLYFLPFYTKSCVRGYTELFPYGLRRFELSPTIIIGKMAEYIRFFLHWDIIPLDLCLLCCQLSASAVANDIKTAKQAQNRREIR
jgi:hypothetical protein